MLRTTLISLLPLLTALCSPPPSRPPVEPGAGEGEGEGEGEGDDDGLSARERAWVTAHNEVRSAADPVPATPLPPMQWDDAAAAVAAASVARCVFAHDVPEGYGENLFVTTAAGTSPQEVVDAWAGEAADYDYVHNTCAPGAQCGHYTQIVWRGSTRVGCAEKFCSSVAGFGGRAGTLVSCAYSPPGNWVGQHPY